MTEPMRYRRRPGPPDPDDGVEAMRFDGSAECAETIRVWLERRYRAVSPYSSVPPPAVEYLVGDAAYLIFEQGNGKHAAAVAGEWLVIDGGKGFRPWHVDPCDFDEYYVPAEPEGKAT